MIAPYVWWQSRYDHNAHAFPVAQTAELERRSYRAVCEHSVTARTVIHRESGNRCAACALIVGSPVPHTGQLSSAATS